MNFRITYEYGEHLDKEIIVKDCMSELHAKVKLKTYLTKKHGDKELRILSCDSNSIYDLFGGTFKDIFK